MDEISLRRPCGDITDATPLCVIWKLARCHGIGYNEERENDEDYVRVAIEHLFNHIGTVPKDSKDWSNENWSQIARFVNPDVRVWSNDRLVQAFESIFKDDKVLEFGPKTNHAPERIDEIEVYTKCCQMGIEISRQTSFVEMTYLVQIHQLPMTWRYLMALPHVDMNSLTQGLISNDLSKVKLNEVQNLEELPRTNLQAIQMGVRRDFDFSLAQVPLLEFFAHLGNPQNYVPVDPVMRQIYEINPFRVKFGYYFNSAIPLELYSVDKLDYFRSLECIERNQSEPSELLYGKLYERSIHNNFHHLLHPEVKHSQTRFTYEDLETGDSGIVSYGVLSTDRNHYLGNVMVAYKLDELGVMFRAQGDFIDPLSNERFSEDAITKLNKLCLCIRNSNLDNEIKEDARKLIQEISNVKQAQNGLNEIVKNWVDMVKSSTYKSQVVKNLEALIDAGMYMRTWDGPPNPYPMDGRVVRDQNKVDELTSAALIHLNDLNESLPHNLRIYRLPLYLYDRGNFIVSNSDAEKRTIGERVELVSMGDTASEIESCIRMSSNWLIGSGYFYLQLLDHRPDFNIEDMHTIA